MLTIAARVFAVLTATTVIVVSVVCGYMFYLLGDGDNPTGYVPGTPKYEAREFFLSVPEVIQGGEWTCDWTVLTPWDEETASP